jgi:ATP-dependent DNA helicase RecG
VYPQGSILDQPIENLKNVGPARGELLRKELGIHKIGDLLFDLPFRYIDKSTVSTIREALTSPDPVQLKGTFNAKYTEGSGPKKRLVATFEDGSGSIDVVWFHRIRDLENWIHLGQPYVLYVKLQ